MANDSLLKYMKAIEEAKKELTHIVKYRSGCIGSYFCTNCKRIKTGSCECMMLCCGGGHGTEKIPDGTWEVYYSYQDYPHQLVTYKDGKYVCAEYLVKLVNSEELTC